MKKILTAILAVILAATFVAALASCGKNTEPTTSSTDKTTPEPTEPATPTSEPTTTPTEPTAQSTEPTAAPTEPTAAPTEPTTEPTLDPAKNYVTVTLAQGEGYTAKSYTAVVEEGEDAKFDVEIDRGHTFVSCSDSSATFDGGVLTLPSVYFDTDLSITTSSARAVFFRLNYPSDEIGSVHAKNQNGYEVGQYLVGDSESVAMGRYYVYDGEMLTLSAKALDGYEFIGWSYDKYVTHGGTVFAKGETLSIDVENDSRFAGESKPNIYANFVKDEDNTITVTYRANGGKTKDDKTTYVVEYNHPVYAYASTLGSELFNVFTRDGYFPIEYNTQPDGSGTPISIGSKATIEGKNIDLYVIWKEITPEGDFEYTVKNNNVTITSYKGLDDTVVIPETIEGKKVTAIADGAFDSTAELKTVVITRNVRTVEDYAFCDLPEFSTLYMCDSVTTIADVSFSGCPKFSNLRMIASLAPVSASSYLESFTQKYERLFMYRDLDVAVFLGGSSMDEGFDGQTMYDMLGGKYMPINLGVNRQITTVAMVEMLKGILDDGDIIVMAPELIKPNVDMSANMQISRWMWMAVESCYDVFRYIDIRGYSVFGGYVQATSYTNKLALNQSRTAQTYDYFMATGTDLANATTIAMSHGACMDKYGNRVSFRFHAPTATTSSSHYASPSSMPQTIATKLNTLNATLKENGVTLFISFCPISQATCYFDESDSNAFVKYLEGALDFDVLGTPMMFVFDDELTNDLQVHLSTAGATERTRRLATELIKALEK